MLPRSIRPEAAPGTEPTAETIAAPSPVLFGLALVAGLLLDRIGSSGGTGTRTHGTGGPNRVVGVVSFVLGTVLFVATIGQMRRIDTSPDHADAPPELLTEGPFGYTRNPIYLGNCLQYVGLSLLADSRWAPRLLVPLMLYLDRVVEREEAYLRARFGNEFERYRHEVRRWL